MPQPTAPALTPLTPGSYSKGSSLWQIWGFSSSPAASGARAPSRQLPLPRDEQRQVIQHNGEQLLITDTCSPAEPPSCCQETRGREKTLGNSTIPCSHLLEGGCLAAETPRPHLGSPRPHLGSTPSLPCCRSRDVPALHDLLPQVWCSL